MEVLAESVRYIWRKGDTRTQITIIEIMLSMTLSFQNIYCFMNLVEFVDFTKLSQ